MMLATKTRGMYKAESLSESDKDYFYGFDPIITPEDNFSAAFNINMGETFVLPTTTLSPSTVAPIFFGGPATLCHADMQQMQSALLDIAAFQPTVYLTNTCRIARSREANSLKKNSLDTINRINIYQNALLDEMQQKVEDVSIHQVYAVFLKTVSKVAEIPFLGATVEILSDFDGLKFTLRLPGERMLFITKFFDDKDFNGNDILYSLYENRKNLISDVVSIDRFIPEFLNYLALTE